MKKILIVLILTVFFTAIAFIKPIESHAETPDVFMMNEIYLYDHDNFNFAPTFENDYLLNATILPNAIETEITAYIGWYKDLGYNQLLIPYYGDDVDNDHLVYFAIPCYDILGANFQLGYIAQTPQELRFGVTFSDGTIQQWDTETNGFGKQILTISNNNLLKNIDSFWWEAKTADYIPSFKFLGVTDGYDIGYQNGENNGYNSGYQVGYNLGFRNGFQDGITQSDDVVIYENVLNFNQIIKNGNFINTNYWSSSGMTLTAENNKLIVETNQVSAVLQSVTLEENHKYFYTSTVNSNNTDITVGIYKNSTAWQYQRLNNQAINTNIKVNLYFDSNSFISTDFFDVRFRFNQNAEYISKFSNVMLIDLTKMYGAGYEPSMEECEQIFTSSYYETTTGLPIQMGYYTGYFQGRDSGLVEGINIGESNQITMSWVQQIFKAIQGVLDIQIFPRVTIGVIVGIPFVISLAWFIIKMFRGGGGGE